MEAMARGRLVLAPALTGIPELVSSGKTGLLYEPGSRKDFVEQVAEIASFLGKGLPSVQAAGGRVQLDCIRHSARMHVLQHFNRSTNLQTVTDLFLHSVSPVQSKDLPHASSLLQQI